MNNKIKSDSIFKKRIRKFKSIKRGYYALIILASIFLFSIFAPLFINDQALYVKYNDKSYFPFLNNMVRETPTLQKFLKLEIYEPGGKTSENRLKFGDENTTSYRLLKEKFIKENSSNYVIMPIYPYGPIEIKALKELDPSYKITNGSRPNWVPSICDFFGLEMNEKTKNAKFTPHILGTDENGRDVFARIIYGFKTSFIFALTVWFLSYLIGISVGAMFGYKGGKIDLFGYRIIEIYSSIPFLFMLMILANFMKPNVFILATMYVILSGWIGISWYVRGEFLREKSKDYVSAAVSMGQSHTKIIFKHILPNALTSIITNAPFVIVGYITSLVALDYLGFGLQPPAPSWGNLISQGHGSNGLFWHLVLFPLICLGITLLLISLIGEAIREAFDPKVHSRLR